MAKFILEVGTRDLRSDHYLCRRDGELVMIPYGELVDGDLVYVNDQLREGGLIERYGATIDELLVRKGISAARLRMVRIAEETQSLSGRYRVTRKWMLKLQAEEGSVIWTTMAN